jgi:hypothetical protein
MLITATPSQSTAMRAQASGQHVCGGMPNPARLRRLAAAAADDDQGRGNDSDNDSDNSATAVLHRPPPKRSAARPVARISVSRIPSRRPPP